MKKSNKIPVSERALVARLQRALAKEGERLQKTRTQRARLELGEYFTVGESNVVARRGFEIEGFARKMGVLREYEEMVE